MEREEVEDVRGVEHAEARVLLDLEEDLEERFLRHEEEP